MRFVIASLIALSASAHACPAPRPTVTKLELVTAANAVLPADGALLIRRVEVLATTATRDAMWTVRVKGGATIDVTVEPLTSNLERWQPKTVADRELEIVDSAGTVIATVRQASTRGTPMPAPGPRRITSTLDRKLENRYSDRGIPGATVVITLGQKPPAGARYLVLGLATANDMPVARWEVAAGQDRFDWITHAAKLCSGGSIPVAIGQRVSLAWVDELGRRSPATKATVAR